MRYSPIATLLAIALAAPAAAQSQAQQERIDQIARYVVTSPMCGRLGMTLDPNLPIKAKTKFDKEITDWHLPTSTTDRLTSEALQRQGRILKTDLDTSAGAAKTDAQLRGLRTILIGYGRTCLEASRDPVFQGLIDIPPGYDLDKAATDAADAILEDGGLASWQTPQIQARGDLLTVAGTCRSKIGPARSDALLRQYGQSDDPRIRAYYRRSFDEGLADPTIISTLAGCNRAIARLRVKAQ